MIYQIFGKKEEPVSSFPVVVSSQSANDEKSVVITEPMGSMFKEAMRREKIIKDLTKNLPYAPGIIVRARKEETPPMEYTVMSICDSYAKFGKTEAWPENDNPMLIELRTNDDNHQIYWCTVNFIEPVK